MQRAMATAAPLPRIGCPGALRCCLLRRLCGGGTGTEASTLDRRVKGQAALLAQRTMRWPGFMWPGSGVCMVAQLLQTMVATISQWCLLHGLCRGSSRGMVTLPPIECYSQCQRRKRSLAVHDWRNLQGPLGQGIGRGAAAACTKAQRVVSAMQCRLSALHALPGQTVGCNQGQHLCTMQKPSHLNLATTIPKPGKGNWGFMPANATEKP
eukprot:scaffold93367_cov21-Tisochrysis_lutea.AAC.1